jgi:hypothetical protein
LQDVKGDPTGEKEGMHPQQNWPSRSGVNKILVNGVAESINDHYGDQQRHGKVEILLQPWSQ